MHSDHINVIYFSSDFLQQSLLCCLLICTCQPTLLAQECVGFLSGMCSSYICLYGICLLQFVFIVVRTSYLFRRKSEDSPDSPKALLSLGVVACIEIQKRTNYNGQLKYSGV